MPVKKKPGLFLRAQHVLNRCAEICLGPVALSRTGQRAWQSHLKRLNIKPARTSRAAVVAHIFYPELLDEVLICWRACPPNTVLHVTTVPEVAAEIGSAIASDTGVHLHVYDNRGRDIAPFIELLNSGSLTPYDAVLKLHTKRSPHLKCGDTRRRLLYANLAGNRYQVDRILSNFDASTTGVVGWSKSYRENEVYWMSNKQRVADLCRSMKPPAPFVVSFFDGSMFWFRPKAFEPLRNLHLAASDFEPEAGQLDGALQHAIERAFNLSALAAGYDIVSSTGSILRRASCRATDELNLVSNQSK